MAVDVTRTSLKRACDELEQVCESTAVSEIERLAGIEEQLRYVVDGDRLDPEETVFPDPAVLDTIHENLATIREQTDDDDAQAGIDRACEELALAIEMLDERWEQQHQV